MRTVKDITFDLLRKLGLTTIVPEIDPRQPAKADPAKIVAAIRHERAKSTGDAEAVQSYLREAAFTTLNRFAALILLGESL